MGMPKVPVPGILEHIAAEQDFYRAGLSGRLCRSIGYGEGYGCRFGTASSGYDFTEHESSDLPYLCGCKHGVLMV